MFKIRITCEHDSTWHYVFEEQETIDTNITCSEHFGSTMRDFVIVEHDEV